MFISNGPLQRRAQCGVTMLEVLVTIVILAFGLLGLAGLQSKLNLGMVESYQRGQAVVLLTDMAERMKALPAVPCKTITVTVSGSRCDRLSTTANPAYAPAISRIQEYSVSGTLGTDDTPAADCSTLATPALRDRCEWSKALQGAAELSGTSDKVGAMTGARGCITELQAPDGTTGVCAPGIYQITVAWQGMHQTKAPAVTCGQNMYGDETYRRAISTQVTLGLPNCQ